MVFQAAASGSRHLPVGSAVWDGLPALEVLNLVEHGGGVGNRSAPRQGGLNGYRWIMRLPCLPGLQLDVPLEHLDTVR